MCGRIDKTKTNKTCKKWNSIILDSKRNETCEKKPCNKLKWNGPKSNDNFCKNINGKHGCFY